MAWHRTG